MLITIKSLFVKVKMYVTRGCEKGEKTVDISDTL
jgi:hypothetical protein